MSSNLRSNNPFAQDAEQEIQQQISGGSSGLIRHTSVNHGAPDPSILETSLIDIPQIDGNGPFPQESTSTSSSTEIPIIQIHQEEPSQQNGNDATTTTHDWQQIQDSHNDEPPPAYSEIDPVSPSASQAELSQSYNRPPGPPPISSSPYRQPMAPPLPTRPARINTQFSPPSGPPPSHSPSSFTRPSGPPPSHLLQPTSPSLPPRPTSPRLPPRPGSNTVPARGHVYPGASASTYSGNPRSRT